MKCLAQPLDILILVDTTCLGRVAISFYRVSLYKAIQHNELDLNHLVQVQGRGSETNIKSNKLSTAFRRSITFLIIAFS